ncbi:hypothetical protein PHYPSEUDO_010638 [Phytophthora pseudosyringae]|uniref:BROMI C-terminal Rab TBC-like domain-containing protein n=1 Tax=Phytophthora pseudosyringae TaxID=221518 RepID=A0A8T1WB74_9STRA|nr:hypothetical protein PHYPSEUDO_010638 [Phytophthora pseudosyringae]
MAQLEATRALEELLLLQRSHIDHALYPLLEDAPLGDLLEHFQSTVLDLQRQEPSFWQLRMVEFIRSVLESRLGGCIEDAVGSAASGAQQDIPAQVVARATAQVQANSKLEPTLRQLQSEVEDEVARLKEALNTDKDENRLGAQEDADKHFVAKFWEKLQHAVELREKQPTSDEGRGGGGLEKDFESCSFERLTFDDDFNDMSRSAMSFPCMEDFPTTIRRMQSADPVERATGLDELMQIPLLEIIHSGPIFPAACSAVVGLFLDREVRGERGESAERAKGVVYDLMKQVEDAAQFLELYWAVLDFMGSRLETGELFLYRQDICESTDQRSIAVLDCFRVLHELLCRIMRHWVYFSVEDFAQLLHATFRLLTMYSKAETEVEAEQVNPLTLLFLIDDHPVRWFKLWLLNAPNSRQLFAAIDDSGFIADLLQRLSRKRPLSPIKSSNPSVDAIEKRTVQCALAILSYICEYRQGRELASQWQRMSAHACIKQRQTTWERPVLEATPAENDSVYRTVNPSVPEEEPRDDLEADYQHLGTGVIDALVLSAATIIVMEPKCSQEGADMSYHERWSLCISNSVATYLHSAGLGDLIAALAKLIDACWADNSSNVSATTELEESNPWFPFRQPKGVTEVCELVIDSISKRTRRGVLSSSGLQSSGQLILRMVLSSKVVTDDVTQTPNSHTSKLIFELCKSYLQSWHREAMTSCDQKYQSSCDPSGLVELISDVAVIPPAFKVANKVGIIDELREGCRSLSKHDVSREFSRLSSRILSAQCHPAAGVRNVHDTPVVNAYLDNHLNELATLSFHPTPAKNIFSLFGVQVTISQIITELQETVDFTVFLNSPDDECPSQLIAQCSRLQWLRCCLSSQFASSSLLSIETSPLIEFISETLAVHKAGFCISSCHAEDTCCVAFQLVLSLVSSVPSMLECSDLLSELKLLNLDGKRILQRDLLCDSTETLGSCSFLEKQLYYEFEFVGGPSEKLPQCELFAFDTHSRQAKNFQESSRGVEASDGNISEFSFTLGKKILQAIQDGVEAGSATPMDFVLISQASWELINDLEDESVAESSSVTCKVAAPFTDIFAKLIYNLVMSKRSRLEPPAKTHVDELDVNSATSPTPNDDAFFPTDSQRKLMNRLYKNYARDLSLNSSPTLLHCIVKKFGKVAMDCFPVTVLMMLYPTYGEADILSFLSHCIRSPSSGFLWPTSVVNSSDSVGGDAVVLATAAISEGVEIILKREFPQLLQAIDQCQCSVLSLVLRWHSQHFWNYLDWENVVIYTYFSILYGADVQVYIIVAILRHLEPRMRELTAKHSSQSLSPFLTLMREPIRNFRFSPWRTLLLRLRSEYHEEVVALLFPSV